VSLCFCVAGFVIYTHTPTKTRVQRALCKVDSTSRCLFGTRLRHRREKKNFFFLYKKGKKYQRRKD
jgi:hypothetical protein